MRKLLKFLILCVGLIIGSQAWAQRTHCTYGYQDSSCGTSIATAAQTPTLCSTGPGWTALAAGVWQGSKFSDPQCHYEAQPSCASGWVQQSAPVWNGSSWVGLACVPPQQPGPTTCQYGFASGPSWNGTAWIYSCNAAPAVTCASQAQSQGFTITSGPSTQGPFTGPYIKFDGTYGSGSYFNKVYGATGPTASDTCGDTSNSYTLYCPVSTTDGSVLGQVTGSANLPGGASCGGPN